MPDQTLPKPLDGVTILDFSRVLAGPFCTALLADQGATVLKIEPPNGDDQRAMGAFRDGYSLSFELINRNKQSLRLNLRTDTGRQIAQRLARRADVVIENFRPGVAARLGIGAAELRAERPELIYCSISGFGQSGPMAQFASYDVIAQALSGLMSLTGEPDGPPVLVGDSIGDIAAGLYAAQAISAALYQRAVSGRGATLDVAMFDTLFSLMPTALAMWQRDGTPPARSGSRHPLSAPFGLFRAADAPVMIAIGNAALFRSFCDAIGRPELAADPRFASDALRKRNEAPLHELIEAWTGQYPAVDVVRILARAGIPVSPIWDVAQAATSDQAHARGLLVTAHQPRAGDILLPEQPVRFEGAPRGAQRPAPGLGADGAAILSDYLGLSAEQIARLQAEDII